MLKRIYATSSASTTILHDTTPSSIERRQASTLKLSNGQDYTPKPGSLITVTRAISARINENYDGFPSSELKKAYRTFVGKPVFVNHNNEDHRRTRGIVIDSVYKEAGEDKYIELTIEVDAKNFPKLASLLATGELDSVSMGTDVKFTKCSYCANVAHDIDDFCDHVKYQKGKKLTKLDPKTGKNEKVLVYESCHGLSFFEISYVFDPADTTAINQKVYLPKMSSLNKEALGELTSPPVVDTLDRNKVCPQCADTGFDGKECKWCEYATPPEEFQDPDTMKSRVLQIVRQDPNAGKEDTRMGATANALQRAVASRRLAEAQRRLAEDVKTPDWSTDVTDIDSNPVTVEDARQPDGTADVTKLEPEAGVGEPKTSRKQAEFPNADPSQEAAPAGPPATPEAAPQDGPESDDNSDASSSIDDLPITWQQDESGQPYGTVDGTGLDIFINEDMTWEVLPEGSDQPIDQGQGSSYEDSVQQAFQSAQSGGAGQAPQDPSAAPADPAAAPTDTTGAPVDPTKVAKMKTADSGVPAASQTAKPDKREDVTKLPDYETMEDGGHTYNKGDYAHNQGDDLRKLDNSTSPEMAPGGGSFTENNKKASVIRTSAAKAMELVEMYVDFGIVAPDRKAKFAAIAKVQELPRDVVLDRIALLEAVETGQQRVASRPRNTVPRVATNKVPNLARSASSPSDVASAVSAIWTL